MKRYLALSLLLVLTLFLCSCSAQQGDGSIHFVSYAGWSDSAQIAESALNPEALAISSEIHLPIYKCDTLAELNDFRTVFSDILVFTRTYDSEPSFEAAAAQITESFFEDNSLLLVYVQANSGSYRFDVSSVSSDSGTLCVNIRQTNDPDIHTDDMAGWLVAISAEKNSLQSITGFDAILKRTDRYS